MAYLYPEKVFDHYVPKFVRYLDDFNIPHNFALNYLNALMNPLLFDPVFPKKFLYLNLILTYAIKEIITVGSENGILALDIIGRVMYFVPLPHQQCLENAYKATIGKRDHSDYGAFLMEKRKAEDNEYYYHELCNIMETRLTELLSKVFAILESKEKPRKGDRPDEFVRKITEVSDALCTNCTDEMFEILFQQFRTFLCAEPHVNVAKEVCVMLRFFDRRNPQEMAKLVVPYVFQALVSKEDARTEKTVLDEYFRTTMPKAYAVACKYSLNKYVSGERLGYYVKILGSLLTYSDRCNKSVGRTSRPTRHTGNR